MAFLSDYPLRPMATTYGSIFSEGGVATSGRDGFGVSGPPAGPEVPALPCESAHDPRSRS
jgi:hypothetical protein